MIVRKVRGKDEVGKIIVSKIEVDAVRRMGVPLEKWVKHMLTIIAKQRRWKWYFNKEKP